MTDKDGDVFSDHGLLRGSMHRPTLSGDTVIPSVKRKDLKTIPLAPKSFAETAREFDDKINRILYEDVMRYRRNKNVVIDFMIQFWGAFYVMIRQVVKLLILPFILTHKYSKAVRKFMKISAKAHTEGLEPNVNGDLIVEPLRIPDNPPNDPLDLVGVDDENRQAVELTAYGDEVFSISDLAEATGRMADVARASALSVEDMGEALRQLRGLDLDNVETRGRGAPTVGSQITVNGRGFTILAVDGSTITLGNSSAEIDDEHRWSYNRETGAIIHMGVLPPEDPPNDDPRQIGAQMVISGVGYTITDFYGNFIVLSNGSEDGHRWTYNRTTGALLSLGQLSSEEAVSVLASTGSTLSPLVIVEGSINSALILEAIEQYRAESHVEPHYHVTLAEGDSIDIEGQEFEILSRNDPIIRFAQVSGGRGYTYEYNARSRTLVVIVEENDNRMTTLSGEEFDRIYRGDWHDPVTGEWQHHEGVFEKVPEPKPLESPEDLLDRRKIILE